MKVMLISLTLFLSQAEKELIIKNDDLYKTYSVGMLYIQSYLESKKHEVKYLDFMLITFDNKNKEILTNEINSFRPEVIGFSMLSFHNITTFRMIEYVHETHPEIKIVVGGIHATIMYRQLIEKYPYIIVVIGEGEVTFNEILEDRPLSSIDGIAFYSDGKLIKTENRELIYDLDSLPFPHHPMNPERKWSNIITSRGCTASCSFCSLNPNAKRIQRFRSAKNVVDEIEIIAKNPNIKTIQFLDDAFLTNNNRVIEICEEIIKRGLNRIEFVCQARFKPFHKEMIPYLEKANFTSLMFGLETANENMLKACHKSIKQQDAINTITLLKDSRILYYPFLIVGLPGETRDTIIETAKFVQRLQKIKYMMYYDEKNPGTLMVYPGTEVYEIMKAAGKITDDYWLTNSVAPFFTVEHSVDELMELRKLLVDHIVFMPLSLTKLYYQKSMLLSIFKYAIKRYKTKPLTLMKTVFMKLTR